MASNFIVLPPDSGGGGGAVISVNGQTGVVILNKADIGLANVQNVDTTIAANIVNVPAGTISATDVQTALNELDTEKQVTITGGATSITTANLTTLRALASDASGKVVVNATTSAELAFVSGVTSAIQTQLNAKQATGNYITVLTGDVTATGPGSVAATIAANAVTNAKAAQMATLTIKGNNTGGTANALDLSVAQVNTMLGTVTNVTASSPLASSGGATPAISISNQTANIVLAGPASGGAAAPTFRTLVIADIATALTNSVSSLTTKTANYTLLATDSIILCDTSGGAFNITLPAPISGKVFRIIDSTGNFQTNNLTLVRNAAEKIEGLAASKILQTAWGFYTIVSNGTDWFIG